MEYWKLSSIGLNWTRLQYLKESTLSCISKLTYNFLWVYFSCIWQIVAFCCCRPLLNYINCWNISILRSHAKLSSQLEDQTTTKTMKATVIDKIIIINAVIVINFIEIFNVDKHQQHTLCLSVVTWISLLQTSTLKT